ncbi:hypothetical protein Y032_0545g3240 [Ancylostoma ceylanicum]|uniref:Uncharacterized protein n=1 Tax=Ancylostoma ceylanicum TaxID=53326 RepID=A0A016WS32_9BILA|nr:hypothetical protein Y032_0545g3240 [Ancylostoma ceylanicum]
MLSPHPSFRFRCDGAVGQSVYLFEKDCTYTYTWGARGSERLGEPTKASRANNRCRRRRTPGFVPISSTPRFSLLRSTPQKVGRYVSRMTMRSALANAPLGVMLRVTDVMQVRTGLWSSTSRQQSRIRDAVAYIKLGKVK